MKTKFILLLSIVFKIGFSQTETEVAGITYHYFSKADYNDKTANSFTNKLETFVNYGHNLGTKTTLFYHVDFKKFIINTSLDTNAMYPKIASHELLTTAIGMKNTLKKNWSLVTIFTNTFSDDFSKNNLDKMSYIRSFLYVNKKKSDLFSYGFGLYVSTVSDNIRILPVLSLEVKSAKKGMKLFFPRYVKFWYKTNDKSYIQLQTKLNSKRIKYNFDTIQSVEIFTVISDVTYNYLLKNKFKLTVGLSFPIQQYSYDLDTYKSNQIGGFGVTTGISYVVF